jgi:sugar phosphate isomerase/epimerase
MGVPAMFATALHVHETEAAKHAANLSFASELNGLMRDFVPDREPVLAFGIGGRDYEWLKIRDSLAAAGREYGELAQREGFHVAIEAHSGAAVDRTSRALWLIEQIGNDRVKLHFDMVHFFLAGESVEEAVPALVPITGHTHVTDTRVHDDGSRDLLLLGQGELDTKGYVRAMHEAGWDDFITLEVSGMVWGKPGYDAVAAAEFAYATLDGAFREAGVPRG